MRTLLKFTIPAARGNQAILDGALEPVIRNLLDTLKPEAAYFLALEGKRAGLIVFDLPEPSQVFHLAEHLFQELDAEVEFYPVMNQEDLIKGLAQTAPEGQVAS